MTYRQFPISIAPHQATPPRVQTVMLQVLLALLPALLVQTLYYGITVLLQVALAIGWALMLEALMLRLRDRPLRPFLSDLSAPLTAVLFVLCLPPSLPWWIGLIGMIAAIVVAKHLYGGLGYNLFNPAMVGYAVVLLCFPREASNWPALLPTSVALDLGDALRAVFQPAAAPDAVAGATALDSLRSLRGQGWSLSEILQQPAFQGSAAEHRVWLALAYLSGGLFLLARRIIRWQVPLALLSAVTVVALPFWLLDPDQYASPLFHLLSGASLIGAFFIATDPVSGCTTPRGRLLFGAGVGVLTMVIRYWGNYPDGLAFAVLIMNAAAPWIDLHTRPRIFGESAPQANANDG